MAKGDREGRRGVREEGGDLRARALSSSFQPRWENNGRVGCVWALARERPVAFADALARRASGPVCQPVALEIRRRSIAIARWIAVARIANRSRKGSTTRAGLVRAVHQVNG